MTGKRTLLLATATAVCAVAFSPLAAQAAPPEPCGQRVFEQAFSVFGDQGSYTLLPGGAFEDQAAPGWLLLGGAAVVSGNEPFFLHSALDTSSLSLPAGSVAVSPATCVGVFDQTFRLTSFFNRLRQAARSATKSPACHHSWTASSRRPTTGPG